MNRTLFAAVLLSAFATTASLSAQAAGGNVEAGKAKAATCFACHGEAGAKPIMPEYPVLAGQHNDYLVAALTQYKQASARTRSWPARPPP